MPEQNLCATEQIVRHRHLERHSVAIHDTIEKVHCELINLFISARGAIALDA